MPVLVDDDVVVYGNAERGSDVGDCLGHLDVGLRGREGSYFGDKTLRMNDASGATVDIIEPLAVRAHDQPKLGGWLIFTSKGPPHLRRPFVPGWAGDDLFQRPCAMEPDKY